ncbi:MAG: NAD-dependent epimerase/dehydratase family protein [Candidatus Harrisonbacteria bacterium]|nr:NAD-dependent epimerase/dehydratase family protein [Candidatus Harrisonbacteria bacterium]
MKKVLITGATGFIGGALVKRLLKNKNYKIICLVRDLSKAAKLKELGAELVKWDMTDSQNVEDAMRNASIVIHLAAVLANKHASKTEMRAVNVDGTRNILKIAKLIGAKQFIFLSSALLSWHRSIDCPNEESPVLPTTEYEKTKLEAERLVKSASSSEFQTTVMRPGVVYGPGGIGFSPLFKAVKTGKFFYVNNGSHIFELTFIDDLIDVILATIGNNSAYGETFIISEQNPKTFREFTEQIARTIGVTPPKLSIPAPVFKIAWMFLYPLELLGLPIPISESTFKTLTLRRVFDTTKAKKMLNYTARISLEEGVKQSVDYYKNIGIL